jgi:hypothetical protein
MKRLLRVLALVLMLPLAVACDGSGAVSPSPPAAVPSLEMSACPPAQARGTVPPAIAICSITYIVNGAEQIVRDGDTLQASRGDEVRIGKVALDVGPFSGDGGQACVDFVPVGQNGEEIASDRRGTHMQKVNPGRTSVRGPDGTWTIGENWRSISAVLNHWPVDSTEDLDCAGGLCERDDRVTVFLQ